MMQRFPIYCLAEDTLLGPLYHRTPDCAGLDDKDFVRFDSPEDLKASAPQLIARLIQCPQCVGG